MIDTTSSDIYNKSESARQSLFHESFTAMAKKKLPKLPAIGAVCLLCALAHCIVNPFEPYIPVATLGALFGSDSVYMEGNRLYPNQCSMVNDTLRIVIHSSDYAIQANHTWEGDFFRLDIYNPAEDSLYGIRDAFIRLARYSSGETPAMSYKLAPSDTIYPGYDINLRMVRFSRSRGDSVQLEIQSAHLRKASMAATDMVITRGLIRGVMQ